MKITKFGHSCLLIEEKDARILLDPGKYSTLQNSVENIDAILITHEHQDHMDIESIKTILAKNPQAKIYTNIGVGKKLKEVGMLFEILLHKQKIDVKGVSVEGVGEKHTLVYRTIPICDNVGYLIASRLLHPGDTLEPPQKSVEILALPAAAPWAKLAETVDYAKAIHAKIAFPIHDAFLKVPNPFYPHLERELGAVGTKWMVIAEGKYIEV